VVSPPFGDELPVDVVEKAVPLKLLATRRFSKPAVASRVEVLEERMVGHQRNARTIYLAYALFVLTTRIP